MRYTAAFDVGTTALKGVLISDAKELAFEKSLPLETVSVGDYKEQNPNDWYKAFCTLSALMVKEVSAENIRGIIMSGQMQDLIPIDGAGKRCAVQRWPGGRRSFPHKFPRWGRQYQADCRKRNGRFNSRRKAPLAKKPRD